MSSAREEFLKMFKNDLVKSLTSQNGEEVVQSIGGLDKIMQVYEIQDIISEGAFGVIVRASSKSQSDAKYAIKLVAGIQLNKLKAR